MAFFLACFTGSVGIFSSSLCKKSITAIILSYVIYLGIYGFPFVVMLIEYLIDINKTDFYVAPFALLINPVFTFIVFFVDRMSGTDILQIFGGSHGGLWNALRNPKIYIIISIVCQVGLTALFVNLSSKRIGPGKK